MTENSRTGNHAETNTHARWWSRRRVGTATAIVTLIGAALAYQIVTSHGQGSSTTNVVPTTSSSTTSSPSVPPLSPADYQQALTSLDATFKTGFGQLTGASTPTAVVAAVGALQSSLNYELSTLVSLRPPSAIGGAQGGLVHDLSAFSADLSSVAAAANQNQVCAGSSAAAMISRLASAVQLRGAFAALATAEPTLPYQIGASFPVATPDAIRELANGTVIAHTTGGGQGELMIDNTGSTEDAVVVLIAVNQTSTPSLTMYVRNHNRATADGISDGSYNLYVTNGTDWDPDAQVFTRNCSFAELDPTQPLTFKTTSTEATTQQITLTPVVGGNISTTSVDPTKFPGHQYDQTFRTGEVDRAGPETGRHP